MKNLIKTIVFFVLLFFSIQFLENNLSPHFITYRFINGFKQEPKNTIDVLNIGDSGIYYDISPMQIFEDYGITSYNFASPAISNIMSYYLMLEATKTQSPKVVIMDATKMFSTPEHENLVHEVTDVLEDDDIKEQIINDPVLNFTDMEKIGLKYPFYRYHDRWAKMKFTSFAQKNDENFYYLKGYFNTWLKKGASNKASYWKHDDKGSDLTPTDVTNYIIKTREYCKEHNISFLIISMPDTKDWNYKKYEAAKKWCKENNVDYLDFNEHIDEIGIDFTTDSADGGEHLNISGATKLSKFLGKYLNENYDLTDHRDDKKYYTWNDNITKYDDERERNYATLQNSTGQ